MKKLIQILILVFLTGCGALALSQVKISQSHLSRLAPSSAAQADVPLFTAGEQGFALDLYRQLNKQPGNLVFSPHSLYMNLTMDYSGARAETERQMTGVLHATLSSDRLHAAASALDQELTAAGAKDSAFQLAVANSLWAQQDFDFLPAYLDLLAQQYGTGIRLVDYKEENPRQQARLAINQWASDQTRGKINELLDLKALEPQTRLVLASTIYFKGEWLERFEPDHGPQLFTLRNGNKVAAPFITSQRFDKNGHSMDIGRYPVAHSANDISVVEIPYKGGRVSFIALLPDINYPLAELEASLNAEKLKSLLTLPPGPYQLFVEMPKFAFETPLELSGSLAALGMPDAFNQNVADFSGMNGKQNIIISAIAQKTFILVNELGTEAASASYTGFIEVAMPISIRLDRPFLFLIIDRPTGAILFLGRMEDPR
jgi:serpin B